MPHPTKNCAWSFIDLSPGKGSGTKRLHSKLTIKMVIHVLPKLVTVQGKMVLYLTGLRR